LETKKRKNPRVSSDKVLLLIDQSHFLVETPQKSPRVIFLKSTPSYTIIVFARHSNTKDPSNPNRANFFSINPQLNYHTSPLPKHQSPTHNTHTIDTTHADLCHHQNFRHQRDA
jgi:hypothetical protein